MPDSNLHLFRSLCGTMSTLILGTITRLTANDISAFATIFAGTATGIYSLVKTYEWWDKWKTRKKYNRLHKK